jgi:hypothetical protein
MLILGLLLLVAAGALILGLLTGPSVNVTFEVFGYQIKSMPVGELFVIGMCTGVVLLAGLVLFFAGWRRSSHKRRARRLELGAKRARENELQEENARLARELAQQRRSSDGTGSPATAGEPAADPAAGAGTSSSDSLDQQRTTVMGSPGAPAGAPAEPSAGAPESRA